jgi:pimeloyl-ACP methyl ester carboxylesterase
MRRGQRRRSGLLVLAAVGGSLLLAPQARAQPSSTAVPVTGKARVEIPTIAWRNCPDAPGVQCASAPVPLDYDQPRGQKITLALVRLPATDARHRIGSLFVNPGGPGESGVSFLEQGNGHILSAEVLARFDVIGFDPRGVGASAPVRCFDTNQERADFFAGMPPFPVTRDEQVRTVARSVEFAQRCRARNGALLDHVSTADVARDMHLLRIAVGDRRLTYVGYSYGTYLGAVYANLFPHSVGAMVLDGVLDPPRLTSGPPGTISSARARSDSGGYATLREFFRLCAAAGPRCAFGAGDPAGEYRRLADRLRAAPAVLSSPDGSTTTVTYADLVLATVVYLERPAMWKDFAALLEQLRLAAAGQPSDAAALRLRSLDGHRDDGYDNSSDAFQAVVCGDTDNPKDPFAWGRVAAERDRVAPYFGSFWTWLTAPCGAWQGPVADRYAGPWKARTARPVLVVNNRFDPTTPYEAAVRLNETLPRSRLLVSDGWGHLASGTSSCVDKAISAYLIRGRLPVAGSICKPDPGYVPFA